MPGTILAMDGPCPFCRPAPQQVFHEGPLVVGIWDAFPVTEGHALVVTRRHVASWFEATPEEQAELLAATDIVRATIEARGPVDGFNIGINVGAAAGQTIPHLHVHVIPRRTGDMVDPRGGVRHVIPRRGNYLRAYEDAVHEPTHEWPAEEAPIVAHPAVVGGPEGPLLPHLIEHLDRAQRADLVVAFVLESGVAALENALHGFLLRGGRLRLLTGDYQGVTDPRALIRLLDLVSFASGGVENEDSSGGGGQQDESRVELRAFECDRSSFHPKAYIFHFDEGPPAPGRETNGVAYVGSSNLTRTGLRDGIEWNYRLVLGRDRVGFGAVVGSFDAMFSHPNTRTLTPKWIEEYARRRPPRTPATLEVPAEPPPPPPEPHAIQQEALAALEATRQEGNRAGLVVMATGLGKTWLAAFDAARLGSRRTLLVAHREEILRQSLATFRRIQPEARLGLYTGQEQTPDADVLFASIQCLGRRNHLDRFAPSAFDLIVVDEFHHAAARTYTRLIDHFQPSFLLGLTATPERTDGGSLLALCDENLVNRCDLFEAIRRAPDRLVPFHYFGVPDDVDYRNIPWRNRRFDVEELTRHVATHARAENALEQWRLRAGGRTLGFCCSQAHADFMAQHFEAAGVRTVAVHSGASSAPRATSLERLAGGELEVLFAVDILNEGVDIPDVDTVLMLRPTESRILFLQQLGRGLRAAEGKTHLTVVDYIGNHRSFQLKPQVLLHLDPGDAPLRSALDAILGGRTEELGLPPGCEVTYELEAVRLLEEQLRAPRAPDALRSWYLDFQERTGRRPLALEALHEGRNPRSARTAHGSWLRFVAAQGGLEPGDRELVDGPDLAGAFLDELERTRMSRSFKMLLLLAMLRADSLPGSMTVEDLAQGFRELTQRSARLVGEVRVDLDDMGVLRSYLEVNPIQAWCSPQGGGRVYFEYEAGRFSSRFEVSGDEREGFRRLARELAEWRLADHLGAGADGVDAGSRIVCKVLQTRGKPILKLPDRRVHPEIPEGEMDVLVDGRRHLARFVKEYVNVIQEHESKTNVLPSLARGWFGEDAGRPGTQFFVGFCHDEGGWTLVPMAPGEATRPTVERAIEKGADMRVLGDDGAEIDATFHVESIEGRISLVYHSAGGTAGTGNALNREYARGLEVLLARLGRERILVEGIFLDTQQTREVPRDERLLRLRGGRDYPLDLAAEPDPPELRRAISAAQGRNPNRRIRIVLSGVGAVDPEALAERLSPRSS